MALPLCLSVIWGSLKLKVALLSNLSTLQLGGSLDEDVSEPADEEKPSTSLDLHCLLFFCIPPHADHGIL